jgi:hypothetical protein
MRRQPGCERLPMRTRPGAVPTLVPPCPPRRFQAVAEMMLVEVAQREVDEKKTESMMVEKIQVEGVFRGTRTILIMGGRSKRHLKVAYDIQELPMLPYGHQLSKLYL